MSVQELVLSGFVVIIALAVICAANRIINRKVDLEPGDKEPPQIE